MGIMLNAIYILRRHAKAAQERLLWNKCQLQDPRDQSLGSPHDSDQASSPLGSV